MQRNMETEQLSGILALYEQKETIRDWRANKEELKKMTIFWNFKGQFNLINQEFFGLAL